MHRVMLAILIETYWAAAAALAVTQVPCPPFTRWDWQVGYGGQVLTGIGLHKYLVPLSHSHHLLWLPWMETHCK
jgi:hypothetical protein